MRRVWSIAKWAALGWLSIGLVVGAVIAFSPYPGDGKVRTWKNRAVVLPISLVAWPWTINVVTHTDPRPIAKLYDEGLINNVPINLKTYQLDFGLVLGMDDNPPLKMISPKRPKGEPPQIIIRGEQQ